MNNIGKGNIDIGFFKQITKVSVFKSLSAIILEWILIISCFLIYIKIKNSLLLFILIPFMATRMYALYSLLHEGVHYLIYPNKKVNDFITKGLLSYPLFVDLVSFRKNHLSHHKFLKTEDDPESLLLNYEEFNFPLQKQILLKILLLDLIGFNFIRYKFIKFKRNRNISIYTSIGPLLFHIVLIGILYYNNLLFYYFLLWIIPYTTFFQVLNRMRLYTEHSNFYDNKLNQYRSLKLNSFQKFFLAPYNLGYHAEHHLFPKVPFYYLPVLHDYLDKSNTKQLKMEVETNYFNLFKYILKK